jgi:hypothetical protein
VEEKVKYETNKIQAILKGSTLEEEALGKDGIRIPMDQNLARLIDTKLDKTDIDKLLKQKVSKAETQMLYRQISTLHK